MITFDTLEMLGDTKAFTSTSISKINKNSRVSQIKNEGLLEALSPETIGIQMQVTASSFIENHPSLM